jgi:hypothetical protein
VGHADKIAAAWLRHYIQPVVGVGLLDLFDLAIGMVGLTPMTALFAARGRFPRSTAGPIFLILGSRRTVSYSCT